MLKALLFSMIALTGFQASALTYWCGSLKYKGEALMEIPENAVHFEVTVSANSVSLSQSSTNMIEVSKPMTKIKQLVEGSIWAVDDYKVTMVGFGKTTSVTLSRASNADWATTCKEVKKPL